MDNSTSLWLKQIRRRQELMDSVIEKCGVDVLKAVRAENGDGFFAARVAIVSVKTTAETGG
jgi:hypothetical protein